MTVEVTQAVSRNDADEIAVGPFMDRYLDGSSFSDDRRELTQAFARHRLAADRIEALERELAATKEREGRVRHALFTIEDNWITNEIEEGDEYSDGFDDGLHDAANVAREALSDG